MFESEEALDLSGLVILYTGDGKGKTTAAFGLAMRAAGHGKRICIIQFMKRCGECGEVKAVKKFDTITLRQFGTGMFVVKGKHKKEDTEEAARGMVFASEALTSGLYDLVILDEICIAVDFGLIDVDDVLELLKKRNPGVDVVLTGRNAPEALIDVADLVTEMKAVKHPYDDGMGAREGIEY
ncbi:MAG: cob(I)yrinic acid a,c-diamide adenosyltransferase [Methanomassiliicoccales archaeon]|jgi:cob(I)alamin adenosyltransferase